MDIAVPGDCNAVQKVIEKQEKYQDLAREIGDLWKTRKKVVLVVVGALGSVSKQLKCHFKQIGFPDRKRTLLKSALLESAHILRKMLEV